MSNRREKDRTTIISIQSANTPDDGSSLVEGRAKRKRVAPTRFEDEDFAEQSPIKKKPLNVKVEKTSPQVVQTQVTPPIKISIKPITPGNIKMPVILTTVDSSKETSKTKPQSAEQKEKVELTNAPVVKIEPSVSAVEVTKLPNHVNSKPVVSNGSERSEENKKEGEPATLIIPVTTAPKPQPVTTKKSAPKPSLLETNLTRQFKP